jgi:hypothetical protein
MFSSQAAGLPQSFITFPGFLASIKKALPPANSAMIV